MKRKKILCFDFDGTLADSLYLEKMSMLKTVQDFGYESVTLENIEEYFGPTEPGVIQHIVSKEESAAAVSYFYRIYIEYQNSLLRKNDAMINMLKTLQQQSDAQLVIVTGRAKETLEITLPYLGLNNFFLQCYTGSEHGVNKAESMRQVLKDFDCEKEDVLYIGDTLKDIEVMKQEGYDILSASYYHDNEYQKLLEENNPGNVLNSIDSLTERLLSII